MRLSVATTVAALVLSACVVGDTSEEPAAAPLDPTFAPAEPSAAPAPSSGAAATASPEAQPDPGSTTSAPGTPPPSPTSGAVAPAAPSPEAAPPASAPSALEARVDDPAGDATASLEREPNWSDLVGATLERRSDRFTLWVDLDGGAPTSSGSADHTMNIASFYDLDGDGRIDVEVWVNLADGGWDSALYDNRDGSGSFSDEDPVEVGVEDGRVRIDFPAEVLDDARSFRWALASEWGRYEQLGTALAVRDDAPDDDRPADFPG